MALTQEQINSLTESQRTNYTTNRLDMVEIDGTQISSYSTFSYYEAKTYVTSPTRSQTGALGNINSYATFVTPRLKISFKYMSITTYRTLMRLINSKNEFTVTCYDPITNTRKTNLMYFSPVDYPEIYQQKLEVLGMLNYEIELICTNNATTNVTITYLPNTEALPSGATVSNMPSNKTVVKNTNVVIGGTPTCSDSSYQFANKWQLSTIPTFYYINGQEYLIYDSITLVAQWNSSSSNGGSD